MSMIGKAVNAGTNAAMYHNPMYRGYSDMISLLGNKTNGLLVKDAEGHTKANANGGGITPKEILQNLNSNSNSATTVTEKISNAAQALSHKIKK